MSFDRLYKILAADAVWDEETNPKPPQSALIADNGTDQSYLVGEGGFSDWDALTSTLVGSWDSTTGLQEGQSYDEEGNVIGTPVFPVTADYATWIRPLGNVDGRATGLLDSTRWAGHAEPKFLQDDHRYPADNSPFGVEVFRTDFGSEAEDWDTLITYAEGDYVLNNGTEVWRSLQDGNQGNPVFGGSAFWEFVNQSGPWGWTARIVEDDPTRDQTNYSMWVYSSVDCTTGFEYQTGSFNLNPETGFYETICPPGNRLTDPDQVNLALHIATLQQGYWNLPEGGGSDTDAFFWKFNQGDGPSPTPVPWFAKPAPDYWDIDSLVTHIGRIWLSTIDNNHWTPGTAGTEALWVDQGPE